MTVLLTGAAGFIGYHTTQRLLLQGESVVGIDNLNPYYSPALKHARLRRLLDHPNFIFHKIDIADRIAMEEAMSGVNLTSIIHLAAQAGVRYSIENPFAVPQTIPTYVSRHARFFFGGDPGSKS